MRRKQSYIFFWPHETSDLHFQGVKNVLISNGTIHSLTKLLALAKKSEVIEILLSILLDVVGDEQNFQCAVVFEENEGVKALCEILKRSDSYRVQRDVIELVHATANEEWSRHVLAQLSYLEVGISLHYWRLDFSFSNFFLTRSFIRSSNYYSL